MKTTGEKLGVMLLENPIMDHTSTILLATPPHSPPAYTNSLLQTTKFV